MKLAAACLLAVSACAQVPEIRGTVIEQDPNIPLPGAEIKVFESSANNDVTLVATIFSDANGAYAFKPARLGNYRLEVRKTGYITNTNGIGEVVRMTANLRSTGPRPDLQPAAFILPGSLTGRVVDEDRRPVAGLEVHVQAGTGSNQSTGRAAVTNDEGIFTATGLIPQPYVVRVAPEALENVTTLPYLDDEFKIVDHDIEVSFSPLVPAQVQPGASANIGTITLRTVPYYRARIRFKGDCAGTEAWPVAILRRDGSGTKEDRFGSMTCSNDFIVRDLAPGSYSLAVWSGPENGRWSLTPLLVGSANIEATLSFSANSDLTASIVVPAGVAQPDLAKVKIALHPAEDAPATRGTFEFAPAGEGRYTIRNVAWPRHSISIEGLLPPHYIKEIRYAGQRIVDQPLSISSGGHIDIVLDDHPATIRGTVKGALPNQKTQMDEALVLAVLEANRGPLWQQVLPPITSVSADGTFAITGLAPGDYRLFVGRFSELPRFIFSSREGGERVHVAAGDIKTVELSLK